MATELKHPTKRQDSYSDMAEAISKGLVVEDYLPDEPLEDDHGRDLCYGRKVSIVDFDEEDFYAKLEVEVTARRWNSPTTYWEQGESGWEVTDLSVSVLDAGRFDEGYNEYPLTEEECKLIALQLKL